MNDLRREMLDDLAALVGCDTRNPPRATAASGIVATLQSRLPGFGFKLQDYGDGCISLLATRGVTDTLFNVHIDTVPAAPGWTVDPLRLIVADDRVVGLGACDIKGAAACLMTVARHTSAPMALLFTSDEEAGDSRCVRRFCADGPGYANVVVAEPTRCRAAMSHRGYVAATASFTGVAGHASELRARDDNAVHHAAQWANHLLQVGDSHAGDSFAGMSGLRLNIGRIGGGIKANMIAAEAEVCFGFRPLPTHDVDALLGQMRDAIPTQRLGGWDTHFKGPPLPARNAQGALSASREFAAANDLPVCEQVDFWSEAALFSSAGCTAIVFGPGDIAQAHSADEWVAIGQLHDALDRYMGMIAHAS